MSYFILYTDEDRVEIKNRIREYYSPIDQRIKDLELSDFQKQIAALQRENKTLKSELAEIKSKPDPVAKFQAEIAALKSELAEIKSKPDPAANLQAEIVALKSELAEIKSKPDPAANFQAELAALKSELSEIKSKPDPAANLQAEIYALKSELAELKSKPAPAANLQAEIAALKSELAEIKSKPDPAANLQAEIAALKSELAEIKSKPDPSAKFQAEIAALKSELAALKSELAEIKGKPTLKPNDEVFITSDRKNIPAQIRKALDVDDMKKFLLADNSETSKQFQKLINVHFNAVKSFVDKLKLDDLDDDELSETVTSKYFKLFHQIIFDNLLVSVKRGLKISEEFYSEFLTKINAYLEHCGIYSVNVKSNVKVTDEDYKNMSPLIIKTSDKTKAGIISEIERVPYRINYLDDFGEKKFFQYNGIMSVYKAV